MKTLDDYLGMYEKAISSASQGDRVIKQAVWIYCQWTEDSGINNPIEAHKAISEVSDCCLRKLLIEGEKIFLAGFSAHIPG